MKSNLRKILAALSVVIATPQFATADEALYEDYLSKHKDKSFCVGMGSVLASDYLEEMIETVGEDTAIRIMDIESANNKGLFENIMAAMLDNNMNKIWKRRFEINIIKIQADAIIQGWEHATNSVEVLGIEKAAENYIEDCE